jgi:hypothetical protein
MLDLYQELKRIDTSLENARALAIVGYAQGNIAVQRFLRERAVAHLGKTYPNMGLTLEHVEGVFEEISCEPRAADYADEERERKASVSNHPLYPTEDQRLDDPRHEEN